MLAKSTSALICTLRLSRYLLTAQIVIDGLLAAWFLFVFFGLACFGIFLSSLFMFVIMGNKIYAFGLFIML